MTRQESTPSRRRALQWSAAGLAAAVPGAWAQAAAPAMRPLQIVGPWELTGLAPANSGYMFARLQIAETLMNAADDGTPQPGLAQRWRLSADGLAWRFELRPGARFHDGTAVTTDAVLRCLAVARKPPSLLSVAPIAAMEAEGSRTVLIRLEAPFGGLPSLLAHSSTIILAPSSYRPDGGVQRIVGTGPFRIAVLSPPQLVEAVAFEGYDGPQPAIRHTRYLTVSRAETRALMIEAGQADLAYSLDPASLQRLRTRRQVPIESATLPRTVIVKLNAGLPALKDVRVRRALSLSIDRAGIAKALLRDPSLAATQMFPPTMTGWHDPTLPALRHDPGEAERLLAEAGWQRTGEGLRGPDGQPMKLVLRGFPDRPELPIFATALQEQWRQAGIAVRVSIGNSGDIPLGHRDGTLDMGLGARNFGTVPDPTGTLLQDYGAQGGDWGAMGWKHDGVVAALAELSRGGVPAERAATLRAGIVRVLQEELPVIPVTWYRQHVAMSPRVARVSVDPLERSYRISGMEWKA
ncbi:ABC transporter substrate-binding protein [Aquincola sp. MAHUQ-54]|uniref:ABC transporter substrate-binding protein n=1 Tax=Aquincola agrisoli TaxID=3119538 RepID=A0AAW9Q092_9BURK